MKRALLYILAVGCLTACASSIADPSDPFLISLNQRLEKQQYMEAAVDLYRVPSLSPEQLAWLEEKAGAGIPPLEYELSRRMWASSPAAALRWYAQGYVGRSLDFSQCADRARNPVYIAMLGVYGNLRDKALDKPDEYAAALEDAIEVVKRRSDTRGPRWICGTMLLPASQREQARQSQLKEIQAGIARLRAK